MKHLKIKSGELVEVWISSAANRIGIFLEAYFYPSDRVVVYLILVGTRKLFCSLQDDKRLTNFVNQDIWHADLVENRLLRIPDTIKMRQ